MKSFRILTEAASCGQCPLNSFCKFTALYKFQQYNRKKYHDTDHYSYNFSIILAENAKN